MKSPGKEETHRKGDHEDVVDAGEEEVGLHARTRTTRREKRGQLAASLFSSFVRREKEMRDVGKDYSL